MGNFNRTIFTVENMRRFEANQSSHRSPFTCMGCLAGAASVPLARGASPQGKQGLYLLFYYAGSSLIGWSGGFLLEWGGWIGLVAWISMLLASSLLFSSGVNAARSSRSAEIYGRGGSNRGSGEIK